MKDRIKQIRKSLDLTQKAFAERIGMKGNTIATYEMGRANPSDATINHICKEFKVNEMWFRTGEGEMFAPAPVTALDKLVSEANLSKREKILIEKFLELSDGVRASMLDYIENVAAVIASESSTEQEAIEKEVDSYRQELQIEAMSKEKLSAYDTTSENTG